MKAYDQIRTDYDAELVTALHAASLELGEAHRLIADQATRLINAQEGCAVKDFHQANNLLDLQGLINKTRLHINQIVEAELFMDRKRS
jgi:hypothetical protein